MYRTSFPDLEWLKAKIASGMEWPTCILDVTGVQDFRSDIQGPYSLFTVQEGRQYCKNESSETILNSETAFCSNNQERYTLDTLSPQTKVFNIHFGQRMSQEVLAYIHLDDRLLLEGPQRLEKPSELGNVHLSAYMQGLIKRLKSKRQFVVDQDPRHHGLVSQLLFSLMVQQHQRAFEKKLRSTKTSTQKEVVKRLRNSIEFLYDHLTEPFSLDLLAASAAMSKFHYARSFHQVFGTTPHRFAEQLKMGRAQKLLLLSKSSIKDIAWQLGYQSSDHFSRSFKGTFQQSPRQFRKSLA